MALAAEGADSETKSQLVETMGGELPDKNSYKEVLTTIKVCILHIVNTMHIQYTPQQVNHRTRQKIRV